MVMGNRSQLKQGACKEGCTKVGVRKRTGKNQTAGKLRTGNRRKSTQVVCQEGWPWYHGSGRDCLIRCGI